MIYYFAFAGFGGAVLIALIFITVYCTLRTKQQRLMAQRRQQELGEPINGVALPYGDISGTRDGEIADYHLQNGPDIPPEAQQYQSAVQLQQQPQPPPDNRRRSAVHAQVLATRESGRRLNVTAHAFPEAEPPQPVLNRLAADRRHRHRSGRHPSSSASRRLRRSGASHTQGNNDGEDSSFRSSSTVSSSTGFSSAHGDGERDADAVYGRGAYLVPDSGMNREDGTTCKVNEDDGKGDGNEAMLAVTDEPRTSTPGPPHAQTTHNPRSAGGSGSQDQSSQARRDGQSTTTGKNVPSRQGMPEPEEASRSHRQRSGGR